MPTYEYECESCSHRFEKFQSMTEVPLSSCPSCGGKVRRLIGLGGGILFKGSGFYQTDYRSENYKKKAESEKPKDAPAPAVKTDAKSKTLPPSSDSGKSVKKPS